jgi:8-oxo-dGTP diphosphatase
VNVRSKDLIEVAVINFYFPDIPNETSDQQVHAYIVKRWEGLPTETTEIKPEWFSIDEIPLNKMWDDAKYWIPLILGGKKIKGDFLFDKKFIVVEHKINTK